MTDSTNKLLRLKNIVNGLSRGQIYRSVYEPSGTLLAEGQEPLRQQLIDDFIKVDVQKKTVIDLGCNFGYFSFLAAEGGAKHVTGIDSMPEAVEGATILADLQNRENVTFQTYNFENPDRQLGRFDMVMLVDFFGKSNIRKQKVRPIIEFMTSISAGELLFAIRPINRIREDLKMEIEHCKRLYPSAYIIDGSFHLLEYICHILGRQWQTRALSEYDGGFCKHKLLFLCKHKITDPIQ